MNVNKLRVFFYFLAFVICASSCGSKSTSSDTDEIREYDSLSDSILKEEAEDTVKKEVPTHIRSKSEIFDYIRNSPDREKYEAGIIPTIAEYVPEYASRLLDNTENGFLIVDKNTMKLYRYDKYGVEQERVGIACARNYGTKHKKADSRTPEGFFSISGIYDSTDWLYTDDDGKTSPVKGQFGPRYMRLATPITSQVGIHGTVAPWSIGGRRSHGCIRMTNENILRIHKLCSPGMPVIVSPGPKDMAVNEFEGYYVPAVPVVKGGRPCVAGKLSDYEKEKLQNNAKPESENDSIKNNEVVIEEETSHAQPAIENENSELTEGDASSEQSASSEE